MSIFNFAIRLADHKELSIINSPVCRYFDLVFKLEMVSPSLWFRYGGYSRLDFYIFYFYYSFAREITFITELWGQLQLN